MGQVTMEVHFQCQFCGQQLEADAGSGGMEIACPTCEKSIVIPSITTHSPPQPPLRSTAPKLKRLGAPPVANRHPAHHTLGENLPHISPTTPDPVAGNESSTIFTIVGASIVLTLVLLAVFNLDTINKWWGGTQPVIANAPAADAEFIKKARPFCAQYRGGGSITAQAGQAEIRMDIQPDAARTLATSLASLYAQTCAAHGAGNEASVTIVSDSGYKTVARASNTTPKP